MSNLLKVENLSRSFGGIHANSDITFDVNEGEILGVIGPNGAGKSTLFDLITGFTKSDKGQVILRDKNITNIRPDLICRLGVGRTFQKLKPFADQTLLENVIVGALVKEKNLKVARDKALEIIDLGFKEDTSFQQELNNTIKFVRSRHKQSEDGFGEVFYTIHPSGSIRRYNPPKSEETPAGSGNVLFKYPKFKDESDYRRAFLFLWQYLRRKANLGDFR